MSEVTVIYDGQCELCRNAISWAGKKLEITTVDFHTAELSQYSLSKEQCARSVFVIYEQNRWSGADAVAFLLKRRGNRFTGAVITALGPISHSGYRWVATNRSSFPVKILSRWLKARS